MEDILLIDLGSVESRKVAINELESGLYLGETIDKEMILVWIARGKNMVARIQRKSRPDWYEITEFDAAGKLVEVLYEAIVV